MELAVDDDPGVLTGMSDKTSPDYINLITRAKRGRQAGGLKASGYSRRPSASLISMVPRFSFCSAGSIAFRSPTATTIMLAGTMYFRAIAWVWASVTARICAEYFA